MKNLFTSLLSVFCFFIGNEINAQVNKMFSNNNYTAIDVNSLIPDGSSEARAASSAKAIKQAYPNSPDGIYYINVPSVGVKQVYCLMDNKYQGGGWMLAMKATRGVSPAFAATTFNFDANYWYTANTLNPNDVTRNDADAKYDIFNYFPATDLLALWPDIPNVGSESGSIDNLTNWSWQQNSFNNGTATTLISFFPSSPTQKTIETSNNNTGTMSFNGFGTPFSKQTGFTFYGFNYTANAATKVRWGFSWNNETNQDSNDVSGGIGMASGSYSAGDRQTCCPATSGINRNARVEMYIR